MISHLFRLELRLLARERGRVFDGYTARPRWSVADLEWFWRSIFDCFAAQ